MRRFISLLRTTLIGSMLLMSSCAFVDQKVDLSYERTVNARGGSGDVEL